MKCKFDLAWIGPCGKDCDGDYCSEQDDDDGFEPATDEPDLSLFVAPPFAIPAEQWAKYVKRLRTGSSDGDERDGDD